MSSFAPAVEGADAIESEAAAQQDELTQIAQDLLEQLDIDITGLNGAEITTEVTMLEEDRIARVRLDGIEAAISVGSVSQTLAVGQPGDIVAIDPTALDGIRLEIEDQRDGLVVRAEAPGEEPLNEFAPDAHLDLITVQRDGQWYVSIGYTMLENIRNTAGGDFAQPDFGRAFDLVESGEGGAESADQAVRNLVTAIESLDYDAMIRLTDPVSLPYLHDYLSLIHI